MAERDFFKVSSGFVYEPEFLFFIKDILIMKFILGKKLEMTQIFREDGTVVPVTAVLATPNVIVQIKSAEGKDGYDAIQVGAGQAKKIIKSRAGHLKDLANCKTLREFRVEKEDITDLKRGDEISVSVFKEGDKVKVIGVSKGKGFQGVVKRHGFHGAPKTHGHKDQERMPGSIGAGGVQRVFKGKKMAGHMGDALVTISGLKVIAIDEEKNILYIKGAVPGARNGEVAIIGLGKMEISQAVVKTEAPTEEIKTEVPAEEVKIETPIEIIEETKVEATPTEETVAVEEAKQE